MIDEETEKDISESPEMNRFYRVLAIIHSNAIHRVMKRGSQNPREIIKRAVEETNHLIKAEREIHKCPPGTIWDEVAGECVRVSVSIE